MTSHDLIRKIESLGWVHVRTKGSHHVFEKEGELQPIVIPHPRKDIATGTLNKILKQAKLR